MKQYKIVSKKDFNKIFKKSFIWTVLSVTDQDGYSRKIAIKKDIFKKTFTVDISGIATSTKQILDHVSLDKSYEIAFNKTSNKIQIPNIGLFTVNNYHLAINNPHQEILTDNTIINNAIALTKDKETDKNKDIMEEKLRNQDEIHAKTVEKLKQEYSEKELRRQSSIKNSLDSITKNLIKGSYEEEGEEVVYETPNDLQKSMGITCVPRTKRTRDKGNISYNLEFLVTELEKYAKNKGYDGFNNNSFTYCINKIDSINNQLKSEYSDEKVKKAYTLHGILVTDLTTRFIDFCRYIKEMGIDTRYSWYNTGTRSYWDDKYTYTYTITDFFQKTIDGIALYTENVYGSDYKNYFLDQVETPKENNKINIKK